MALKNAIPKNQKKHRSRTTPKKIPRRHQAPKVLDSFKALWATLLAKIDRWPRKKILCYQKIFFWGGCLLTTTGLGILGFEYLAAPEIKLAPLNLEERCSFLEQQIDNFIGEANYCQTSDDCLVWEPSELVCPFGCYLLVNKKNDNSNKVIQKSIATALKQYQKGCPLCLYKCPLKPSAVDLICLNHKCIDRRFYAQPSVLSQKNEVALSLLPPASGVDSAQKDLLYSVFESSLTNFQKTIAFPSSATKITSIEAIKLAQGACNIKVSPQATPASDLSNQQKKELTQITGTEFDWMVEFKAADKTIRALINQDRLAVVCYTILEQ